MRTQSMVMTIALKILGYLIENNIVVGKSIKVKELINSTGISEEEYDPADSYLLQQKYIEGTMGGKEGSRWITGRGIEFYEDKKLSAQSSEIDNSVGIPASRNMSSPSKGRTMPDPRKVFVVHGRDERLRRDFFTFLRALDLQPLEWSEALKLTGKASPYIGEILDSAFNSAQSIVVLLTPDDEVRLVQELWSPNDEQNEKEFHLQARPNVLFEAGMAIGRDPDRTLIIKVGEVKPFSDIAGRHIVYLKNDSESRKDVADRLQTAGCSVSMIGSDWLQVGDFTVTRSETAPVSEDYKGAPDIKWVDINYPNDIGLIDEYLEKGYQVKWSSDKKLARRLDIEGWSLVIIPEETGKRVKLKLKDRPHDQTLIMKRESKHS